MKLGRRTVSSSRFRTAALMVGALIFGIPATSAALESGMTNKQFLRWCQTDSSACLKEAQLQAKASAITLKVIEVQTGNCAAEFPENINVKVLTKVGLDYIKNTADPDEEVSWSFTQALMEAYPCSK